MRVITDEQDESGEYRSFRVVLADHEEYIKMLATRAAEDCLVHRGFPKDIEECHELMNYLKQKKRGTGKIKDLLLSALIMTGGGTMLVAFLTFLFNALGLSLGE